MARIIDADIHFLEPDDVYLEHIDPEQREDALYVERDAGGWAWLVWRGRRLHPVDHHVPGRVDAIGDQRRRRRAGEPADEVERASHTLDAAAWLTLLDAHGSDAALAFPNLGLLWEDHLRDDVPALCANLGAYNRWAVEQARAGAGRIHPAAQLSLRDLDWAEREIERIARGGLRAAMVGAHPVGDHALAHPDFDRIWAAFQANGVAVCFHVSNIQLPLDPAWYALDPEPLNRVMDTAFLYLAPAVAITGLIVHGVLERFPGLRIGVVEQSAGWVPGYLLHLDGAFAFYRAQNGRPLTEMPLRPSEYFRRQVRVNAFPLEAPARLIEQSGPELYMWGSDHPHAEGMEKPSFQDYLGLQPRPLEPAEHDALAGGNAAFLLGLDR